MTGLGLDPPLILHLPAIILHRVRLTDTVDVLLMPGFEMSGPNIPFEGFLVR